MTSFIAVFYSTWGIGYWIVVVEVLSGVHVSIGNHLRSIFQNRSPPWEDLAMLQKLGAKGLRGFAGPLESLIPPLLCLSDIFLPSTPITRLLALSFEVLDTPGDICNMCHMRLHAEIWSCELTFRQLSPCLLPRSLQLVG